MATTSTRSGTPRRAPRRAASSASTASPSSTSGSPRWRWTPPATSSSAGAALTGDVAVNTVTAGAQTAPVVAVGTAGDFVVAWASAGQDGDGQGVYARRFNAAAAPAGEFRVNSFTAGDQGTPAVTTDAA